MALDLIVLGILLFSAIVAFFRGFIKEVLTIVGLIGASLAAIWFGPAFNGVTSGWFPAEGKAFDILPWKYVSLGTSYTLVFVIVLVALSLLAHWISALVRAAGLGPVDRSLGVVFGLLRGVLLVGLLYLPFHIILSDDQKREYFGDAKTLTYTTYVAELMQAFLPSQETVAKATGKDMPSEPNATTPAPPETPATTGFDPLNGLTGDKNVKQ